MEAGRMQGQWISKWRDGTWASVQYKDDACLGLKVPVRPGPAAPAGTGASCLGGGCRAGGRWDVFARRGTGRAAEGGRGDVPTVRLSLPHRPNLTAPSPRRRPCRCAATASVRAPLAACSCSGAFGDSGCRWDRNAIRTDSSWSARGCGPMASLRLHAVAALSGAGRGGGDGPDGVGWVTVGGSYAGRARGCLGGRHCQCTQSIVNLTVCSYDPIPLRVPCRAQLGPAAAACCTACPQLTPPLLS